MIRATTGTKSARIAAAPVPPAMRRAVVGDRVSIPARYQDGRRRKGLAGLVGVMTEATLNPEPSRLVCISHGGLDVWARFLDLALITPPPPPAKPRGVDVEFINGNRAKVQRKPRAKKP